MIQAYTDDILVYTTSQLAQPNITKHCNYREMEKWADQLGMEFAHFPFGKKTAEKSLLVSEIA